MENNVETKASNGSIIKTGDMVLIRDCSDCCWYISVFGNRINEHYVCSNGIIVDQCIPLNNNEHLCGTNNNFKESYIPKFGDRVKGINNYNEEVEGIITFYNEEYKPYKYVVHTCLSTPEGFNSYTHVCKSVKPIKE